MVNDSSLTPALSAGRKTTSMTTHIAMLRGINVTGHHIIRMEALRASFTALGFKNVKTYIQSGNVIFETDKPAAGLSAKIEKRILGDFGF